MFVGRSFRFVRVCTLRHAGLVSASAHLIETFFCARANRLRVCSSAPILGSGL